MRKRILAIDDDPLVRELIGEALGGEFRVDTAETGAEGLEKCDSFAPDLVLLDVGLPDVDGLDLVEPIQAGSVVIVMTANSSVEEPHAQRPSSPLPSETSGTTFSLDSNDADSLHSTPQPPGNPIPPPHRAK